MTREKAIEILRACEPVSLEGQPESVKDFREALTYAISVLERMTEEGIEKMLGTISLEFDTIASLLGIEIVKKHQKVDLNLLNKFYIHSILQHLKGEE
jgi:hypothetical protein